MKKTSSVVSKKDLAQAMKKDKKDDMKMIKSAMNKKAKK